MYNEVFFGCNVLIATQRQKSKEARELEKIVLTVYCGTEHLVHAIREKLRILKVCEDNVITVFVPSVSQGLHIRSSEKPLVRISVSKTSANSDDFAKIRKMFECNEKAIIQVEIVDFL